MKLVSVYQYEGADRILYDLLKEREGAKDINISHGGKTPAWREHLRFFRSRPYRVWFLIEVGTEIAGSIYLSKQDEIGVFLFRRCWGRSIGPNAIRALIKTQRRKRYFANINPANERSQAMFMDLGFMPLQWTYVYEP